MSLSLSENVLSESKGGTGGVGTDVSDGLLEEAQFSRSIRVAWQQRSLPDCSRLNRPFIG